MAALAILVLYPLRAFGACTCDPTVSYQTNAEWAGPFSATANVDVNLGNTPANFVTAASYQITGSAPSAPFLAAQVSNLTTLPFWRRIDTVNTILTNAGSSKTRVYSDPWQAQPDYLTAPCKNVARDVGAVFMYFFDCPGGVNCGMQWANNHALGMEALSPVYRFGASPSGYYDPNTNAGFFYRELLDARYAGLQFLLPNVYGPDLSDGSLTQLVAALNAQDALVGTDRPVKVGMFDDTWGWTNYAFAPWNSPPDMSTVAQTANAASKIYLNKWKPFFTAVPPQYWYTVGGRPMIYFYNAGTLGGATNASAVLQAAMNLFAADFGVTPFLVVDKYFWLTDPAMTTVADSKFTWKTVNAGLPGDKTRYVKNGITLDHAMVRWDPLGRDSGGATNVTAAPADGLIKDTSLLTPLLSGSLDASILVIASWNDLGEGTGINRAKDYYFGGQWQPPTVFMDLIRESQQGYSCPVGTFTETPSLTPSPTVTATASPSVTRSASPSATSSSSPTATYSSSPTHTTTATPSMSATSTPTVTPSASPSESPTASPSWTATPSASPSLTETSTATWTPAASPTATATSTPYFSPTETDTLAPSSTGTPSATESPAYTLTSTPSLTFSFTATLSASPTASPTVTPSATPAFTSTATPTAGANAGTGGLPFPLELVPWPNPQAGPLLHFKVRMKSPADEIVLKVYGASMARLAGGRVVGAFQGGWNDLSLTLDAPLPAGLFFVTALGRRANGEEAEGLAPARLMLLP